jgi:hypothetical protein
MNYDSAMEASNSEKKRGVFSFPARRFCAANPQMRRTQTAMAIFTNLLREKKEKESFKRWRGGSGGTERNSTKLGDGRQLGFGKKGELRERLGFRLRSLQEGKEEEGPVRVRVRVRVSWAAAASEGKP